MHIVGRLKIIHFLKRLVFGQNVAAWLGAGSGGCSWSSRCLPLHLALKAFVDEGLDTSPTERCVLGGVSVRMLITGQYKTLENSRDLCFSLGDKLGFNSQGSHKSISLTHALT